jgi:hypothetical protein
VGGGGKSPAPKDGQVGGDPTQKPSGTDKSTGGKSGEFPKDVEEHLPGAGNIQTLPDTDQLQGLDMADARDFLARVIQRIQRDREQALQQTTPISGAVKDW